MGIIGRRTESEADRDSLRHIRIIGTDEISPKKGRNDFVTVFTSYADNRLKIFGTVSGREKSDVRNFYPIFRRDCSVASVKIRNFNEYLIKRFCNMSGPDFSSIKSSDAYNGIINIGAIAA